MALNIRNPNTQALLSFVCSLISLVMMSALAFLVFQRYSLREQAILYSSSSLRVPVVLLLAAVGGLLALIGLSLGLASIGHIRNDHPKRSWVGFLAGAFAMTVTGLLFLAFWMLKQEVLT